MKFTSVVTSRPVWSQRKRRYAASIVAVIVASGAFAATATAASAGTVGLASPSSESAIGPTPTLQAEVSDTPASTARPTATLSSPVSPSPSSAATEENAPTAVPTASSPATNLGAGLATAETPASEETVTTSPSQGAAVAEDAGVVCLFEGGFYAPGQWVIYLGRTIICGLDKNGNPAWQAYPGCGYNGRLYGYWDTYTDVNGNVYRCTPDLSSPPLAIWVLWKGNINPAMRHLQTQSGSGLCIGVSGGSAAIGAKVVQGGCVSGDHSQSWAQEAVSGDYGFLINWRSGLCIDVNGSGLLIQSICNTGATHMLWRKYTSGSGWVFQNNASGQIISVPGGYSTPGWQLGVYADLGVSYQRWNILPVIFT